MESPRKCTVIDRWNFEFDAVEIDAVASAGTRYRRRLTVGMPKIPPTILHSPFYLYPSKEDALAGKPFGGTGFLVGYPTGLSDGSYFPYGVTNWHVAVRDGNSVIRMNKIEGGVEIFEFGPEQWDFQPGGHDLAVISTSLLTITPKVHELAMITLDMFIDEKTVADFSINAGEDIFMVGRFVDHDGAERNQPAARFGHISVMPQIIPQPTGAKNLPSFILDVHSRTGYSGSPVFVFRTHASDLTRKNLVIGPPDTHFVRFLGLHWGQFPELWEIETGSKAKSEGLVLSDDIKYIKGMSGMTMAVPAWAIREFLEMPKYRQEREELLARHREKHGIGPVAESSAPPATDENPNAREDFTRLVGAAAQKKPRGDQT